MSNEKKRVLVIGAGLAGCDAAFFLAERGVEVILMECKTIKLGPAQKMTTFGELVCTNSLKSKAAASAHGALKNEMRLLGSLVLETGEEFAVPAGDALAVDREKFSQALSDKLHRHPLISVVEKEADNPIALMEEFACDYVIVATGPLTTGPLQQWLVQELSKEDWYFYDAIAPVVDADSLDYSKLYYKDRHKTVSEEEGVDADYLNAPLNKEQYESFIKSLVEAEKVPAQDFEDYKFFESCLPVDIMAERGKDTARFSCMKPIGLEMADGTLPYACVQLRKENLLGSAFNLVGFQTRLKYPEQVRVFRQIPGLENAQFIHLGSVHRNTFLNARKLLNRDMSSKKFPNIFFAGQITGVEGYTESASMGLYAAGQIWSQICQREVPTWPVETAIGALVNYVMTVTKPCPSNINFGLLPTVLMKEKIKNRGERKKMKKLLAAERAKASFDQFYDTYLRPEIGA